MNIACCILCPRACRVNRTAGETGFCGMDDTLRVARAALHLWEEPCLSGTRGSGAVFFSGCSLRCVYCQNDQISGGESGLPISTQRLCEIFFELKAQGAHNINLITPTHFVPQIRAALQESRRNRLGIPVIYNTGGYELPKTLQLLDGLVDIYLPDFKYASSALAARYSQAADYPECAKQAIAEMVRQTGSAVLDEDGIMQRGTIVRHLLLPGQLSDSKAVIQALFETYGNRIWYSLMNQYTPVSRPDLPPELRRPVSQEEYDELVDYAADLGIENGFIQEGGTAEESFIPPFDNTGVLAPGC